jgi:predicted Zn finger-like uncharacterized protein
MEVRCERCRTQYAFDDDQVTEAGLNVQCSKCGHLFRVKTKALVVTMPLKPEDFGDIAPIMADQAKRPAGAPPPGQTPTPAPAEKQREWKVRQASGNVLSFKELTSLQKWIVERKVGRDDQISLSGEQWKRLGDIQELSSFFQVVEEAGRTKVAPPALAGAFQAPGFGPPAAHAQQASPPASGAGSGRPENGEPAWKGEPPPAAPSSTSSEPAWAGTGAGHGSAISEDVELRTEELRLAFAGRRRRRGKGRTIALMAVLLLVGGAAAAYLLGPGLIGVQLGARAAGWNASHAQVPKPVVAPDAPLGTTPGPTPTVTGAPPVPPVPTPTAGPDPRATPPAHPAPPGAGDRKPGAEPAPKDARTLLAEAKKLREGGHSDKALDLYGRVLGLEPENVEALAGRGWCYLDLSKYSPAEESFRQALARDGKQADGLMGLAETYRYEGRRPDAVKYYELYLASHPEGDEAVAARNALTQLKE